jgi:hypothetical protein
MRATCCCISMAGIELYQCPLSRVAVIPVREPEDE